VASVPSARRERALHRSTLGKLLLADLLQPARGQFPRELVIGFAGFWTILDEAHIISIAVRKAYLSQGIGQGLLLSVIDMASKLHNRMVTLEVRESNMAARRLYEKFGFVVVGKRPGYYSDNQEDAILMSLEDLHAPDFQAHFGRLKSEILHKECLAKPIELSADAFEEGFD